MTQRPSIALLTCLWRRWPLTGLVLAHYADLRESMADRLTLELVCVGSEGDVSRTAAEAAGAHYLEHDNLPLGAKFNAGLTLARSLETEAVLIAGSDDLADVQLLERYRCGLVEGARFMGLRDMYFLDLRTRRLCFWPGYKPGPRYGDTLGFGRLIHRELLDTLDWQLWDDALSKGLDASMSARLQPHLYDWARFPSRTLRCMEDSVVAVGVKSDTNIWTFDQVAAVTRPRRLDAMPFIRNHFPSLEALLV